MSYDFDEVDRLKEKSNKNVHVSSKGKQNNIYIKDIDMPFGSMVTFMIKWAFASIPALIIISILWTILGGFLSSIFVGFYSSLN